MVTVAPGNYEILPRIKNSTLLCIVHVIGYIFAMQIIKMNIENSKAQLRKGILEFCVLALLRKGEAYPSDLLKSLKEAELIVVEGTLYPLLNRLKNAGLLTYRWEESKSGPPRKYYSLTEQGKTFYKELAQSWDELQKSIDKLLEEPKTQS